MPPEIREIQFCNCAVSDLGWHFPGDANLEVEAANPDARRRDLAFRRRCGRASDADAAPAQRPVFQRWGGAARVPAGFRIPTAEPLQLNLTAKPLKLNPSR